MRMRRIAILTGALAALALPAASTMALDLNIGGVGVSIGESGGGSGSGSGSASISASIGAAGSGSANTANANVNLGTGSGGSGLKATADLNGDGVINFEDDALLAALDINGDGVLNILDDVNGDGVISELDLGEADASALIQLGGGDDNEAKVTLGAANAVADDAEAELALGFGAQDANGAVGLNAGGNSFGGQFDVDIGDLIGIAPDGPDGGGDETPTPIRPDDIAQAVLTLDDDELAALKVNCRTILANPGAYSAGAVAVCKIAVASL